MTTSNYKESILEKIGTIRDLPAFPHVASRVISLVNNKKSSMSEIADVIKEDPSLTANVLRFVNSAYYGVRNRVDSIRLALVMLGMQEVRNIVIGLSIYRVFDENMKVKNEDRERFWEHSIGTGQISSLIARKLGITREGGFFTAGLLHDMGKIILDYYFNDLFEASLDYAEKHRISLYEAELELYDVTHAEVGAWLCDQWGLPERLKNAVLYHHAPENAEKDMLLAAIICLANTLSKTQDYRFGGVFNYVALSDTTAWHIIEDHFPAINEMDVERFSFELQQEIEKAMSWLPVKATEEEKE